MTAALPTIDTLVEDFYSSASRRTAHGSNPVIRLGAFAQDADVCMEFTDGDFNTCQFGMQAGSFYLISNGSKVWEIGVEVPTKTANYTLANTNVEVFFDTTGGAITAKLPPSPRNGQIHTIKKKNQTSSALTLDGNGNNLEGSASTIGTGATTTPIAWRVKFQTGTGWWFL